MKSKTVPYELLVRWNADGILVGASFATRTVYSDANEILFDKIADPVPVGLDADADRSVADVLTPENLDVIRSVNLIAGERDQLARMLSSVSAELDALRRQAVPMRGAPIALDPR